MRYALGQRVTTTDRNGHEVVRTEVFGASLVFEDLLLSFPDGHVLVPAGLTLDVRFDSDGLSPLPSFSGELPPQIAHLINRHSRGEIVYAEQTLRNGDPIELLATVAPTELRDVPLAAAGYREAPGSRAWRVVDDDDVRPRIVDRSLDDVRL
jgi:hypothetical protein